MSWANLTLATPSSSAFNVNHKLLTFAVSPWVFEHNEKQGAVTLLSFPAAIDAVINQLPVLSGGACFALAVSASNLRDFAKACAHLSASFPLQQLDQWQRRAEQLEQLESNKMNLMTHEPVQRSHFIHSVPTVARFHKKALSQQALSDAAALASADPLTHLNSFEIAKTAFDANVAIDEQVSGGSGFRFYSEGNIASDLRVGHPTATQSLTAILAFAGTPNDLSFLTELMP